MMATNVGPGSPMLELLDVTDTIKNSPGSNMPSCVILIVAHSDVPDVLSNVNDSVIGVKSRNAEEEQGKREKRGERGRGRGGDREQCCIIRTLSL